MESGRIFYGKNAKALDNRATAIGHNAVASRVGDLALGAESATDIVTSVNGATIGGLEYLAELPEKVPTTANVDKYIKIVEEKAILRNLIKTANEIITLGYDPTEEVENIILS